MSKLEMINYIIWFKKIYRYRYYKYEQLTSTRKEISI